MSVEVLPNIQQNVADNEEEKKEETMSKSVVGIIYPPPEVRNIVDKTADFVARNGPEFEGRIRQNEAGNPKFNFLNQTNPYHAYYQHKIKEVQEGIAFEASQPKPTQMQPKPQPAAVAAMVSEAEVLAEPPPEFEFIVDPPAISRRHLDIIKLTARFVARDGPQFMDQLMMREQKNETFDFLRKNHILFSYFTKMVEQYSKILMPSHSMMKELEETLESPYKVLQRVDKRVTWEKYQEREKQRAEAAAEKERVEYAQIDWHDFVICETINFREDEAGYLPPPIQPNQLASRLLQQNKFDKIQDEVGEVEDVEMEVEEVEPEKAKAVEDMETTPVPPPPPLMPSLSSTSSNLQIRKDYDPKARNPPSGPTVSSQTGNQQQFLISPITGERVPADKMEEHMKHALLDRRWAEEKKRQIEERQNEDLVLAEGNQIAENIGKIARKRTDIFGREETMIGLEIGEEKKKNTPTVQWDGHTASAEIARQQAQAKVSVREQLEHIQRVQGLLSDPEMERIGPKVTTPSFQPNPPPPQSAPPPVPRPPPPQPRPLVSTPQPPPPSQPAPPRPVPLVQPSPQLPPPRPLLPTPHHGMPPGIPPSHGPPGMMPHPPPPMQPLIHPAPHVEPPTAKKPRNEDNLIPENEFITNNPGPVTFKVQVPNMPDRTEWNLTGQFLTMSLPITDSVSVIKAKISDELGMPAGKQKLQIAAMFIKDSNSLGFYNFTSSTIVQLGLKERGGKKR